MQLLGSRSFSGFVQIIGAIKGKLANYFRPAGIKIDYAGHNILTGNSVQVSNADEMLA